MLKKILLDGKEFHFTQYDLPILIHGEEHVGASLFTVSVLADLYAQGSKVIALTGYPMAKNAFVEQTGSEENVQFFTKEKADDFINYISQTPDLNDHTVLIKNIELFNEEVFNTVKNINNLILSGDVNKCSFKEELLQNTFNTKIYFSPLDEKIPDLQKYYGYFVSQNHIGFVSVE